MTRSVSRSASLTRDHTSEAHDDDAMESKDNNAGSTLRARSKTRSKSKRSSKRKRSHTSRNRSQWNQTATSSQRETIIKKRHDRRTRSPSTSCSSSSGESTVIDCNTDIDSSSGFEDSDMNIYIPPPSAFSSQIGTHLSKIDQMC